MNVNIIFWVIMFLIRNTEGNVLGFFVVFVWIKPVEYPTVPGNVYSYVVVIKDLLKSKGKKWTPNSSLRVHLSEIKLAKNYDID